MIDPRISYERLKELIAEHPDFKAYLESRLFEKFYRTPAARLLDCWLSAKESAKTPVEPEKFRLVLNDENGELVFRVHVSGAVEYGVAYSEGLCRKMFDKAINQLGDNGPIITVADGH